MKIKSVATFVKFWPANGRREEDSVNVVANTKEEATKQISDIISALVSTEQNEDKTISFQCYCKNVIYTEIYQAEEFDIDTAEIKLTPSEVLDFIVKNSVRLVPTKLQWETETGEPATFVTHDVYVGKSRYQGMSVNAAIHKHVNTLPVETEATPEDTLAA